MPARFERLALNTLHVCDIAHSCLGETDLARQHLAAALA
jgi:hypothetical protein